MIVQPRFGKAALDRRDAYGESLSQASILVVDDEPGMRNFLAKTFEPRCKRLAQSSGPQAAADILDGAHFDLIILDNIMPGCTGLDWLSEQRKIGLYADIIMITAYADLETAIKALRSGVTDFVLKPFRANQILTAAARVLDRKYLQRDNYLLRHALSVDGDLARGRLVGKSSRIQSVRTMLTKLAPLPTSVLFTGPSGTGKEVAARTLHAMSGRSSKPFVAVNCAAIAPDRVAEELFGVVDGTKSRQDGLFLHADGGTLFLDEV